MNSDSDIDLILDFLHTRQNPDGLGSPALFSDWIAAHELVPGETPTPAEIAQARHLRAALTTVLLSGEVAWNDDRTRQTIETATAHAPLHIVRGEGGVPDLRPAAAGATGALAAIVAAFYRVSVRGQSHRLKACAACGHGFFDVSKNNSRRWCDMAICGSQQKSREYRKRLAAEKRKA